MLEACLLGLALALPVSIAGTNVSLAAVTAALILRARGVDWRRLWSPAALALCFYVAAALVTALTGLSPSTSMHDVLKELHKLWVFFILLAAFRAAPDRRLAAALSLSLTFVAAYAMAQSAQGGWSRAHAFVHPVTCGEILGLGLIGALAMLARGQAGRRWPAAAFAAALAAALVLNQTRAAMAGVLAGFGAICLAQPALRRWLKWAVPAALLGWALMELIPTDRSLLVSLRHLCAGGQTDHQFDRLILWRAAWDIFQRHPWLGVGPANYAAVFPAYYHGALDSWTSAHNLFLHQMAERGLLGLAALLALWAAWLGRAWSRARPQPGLWNLWALGATVGFLVMNLTETALQNEQITALFLFFWARAEARPDD